MLTLSIADIHYVRQNWAESLLFTALEYNDPIYFDLPVTSLNSVVFNHVAVLRFHK